MQTIFEILSVLQDAGLILVIIAVAIKVGQDQKHIIAYAVFIGLLLLI